MTSHNDLKVLEREQFDTYTAVTKALAPYTEGARAGDTKLLRSIFADHASIAGIYGGKLMATGADAVLEWPANPSPDVQVHIAALDISGPAAYAKLEIIDWMGMRFTDYLLLVRVDGQWKISAKLSDAHSDGLEAQS